MVPGSEDETIRFCHDSRMARQPARRARCCHPFQRVGPTGLSSECDEHRPLVAAPLLASPCHHRDSGEDGSRRPTVFIKPTASDPNGRTLHSQSAPGPIGQNSILRLARSQGHRLRRTWGCTWESSSAQVTDWQPLPLLFSHHSNAGRIDAATADQSSAGNLRLTVDQRDRWQRLLFPADG